MVLTRKVSFFYKIDSTNYLLKKILLFVKKNCTNLNDEL